LVEEYKKAILRELAAASQPLDVERIRVKSNIANWQTALKHCLELLHEGKIQGIKTSKSWIFWTKSRHTIPLATLSAEADRGTRR
jgi:hypothetical protein